MSDYIKVALIVLLAAPFVLVLELFAGLNAYGWYTRRRANTRWYEARLLREQARTPRCARESRRLGQLYSVRWWQTEGAARLSNAREALRWFELALRLESNPYSRSSLLREVTLFAYEANEFDVARDRARQLLRSNVDHLDFTQSMARHYGNIVLGRLALRDGNITAAEQSLLKSANVSCCGGLGSHGPSMSLARELLMAGRTEVVREYIERCNAFWKRNRGKVKRCLAQIARGEIPDFGKQARW